MNKSIIIALPILLFILIPTVQAEYIYAESDFSINNWHTSNPTYFFVNTTAEQGQFKTESSQNWFASHIDYNRSGDVIVEGYVNITDNSTCSGSERSVLVLSLSEFNQSFTTSYNADDVMYLAFRRYSTGESQAFMGYIGGGSDVSDSESGNQYAWLLNTKYYWNLTKIGTDWDTQIWDETKTTRYYNKTYSVARDVNYLVVSNYQYGDSCSLDGHLNDIVAYSTQEEPSPPFDMTAEYGLNTDPDNGYYGGTETKRWFYANVTANGTIESATLEVLRPDKTTSSNYSMSTNNYFADRNTTSIAMSLAGNGTYYYRAWVFNGSSFNLTDWREVSYNLTYIQYDIDTDSSDFPESCYSYDGIIYCSQGGSPTNTYKSWYVNNGTLYQSYGDNNPSNSAPIVDENFVYGLYSNCEIRKWHKENGTQVCVIDIGSSCGSEGLVTNQAKDRLYVVESNGGNMYSIWMSNCTTDQQTSEGFANNPVPVLDEDANRIYIATNNLAYSYYLNNFTIDWSTAINGHLRYGTPTIVDGSYVDNDKTIYFPTSTGYIYAIYENGTERWNVDTGCPAIFQGVAYNKGMIITGCGETGNVQPTVISYWANNGTQVWNFTNTSISNGSCGHNPVIVSDDDGDYVLASCTDCFGDSGCNGASGYSNYYNVLYILNADDGSYIDQLKYGNRSSSIKTLISHGYFISGSQNNAFKFYALKIAEGSNSNGGISQFADAFHTHNYGTTHATNLFFSDDPYDPDITIPTIDWVDPVASDGTESENKTYIVWNVSVNEDASVLIQINGTNQTAICINATTDTYCYYNETGFSTNQTRCAYGYAFDGSGNNNITSEERCRELVFMSEIPPTPSVAPINNVPAPFNSILAIVIGAGWILFALAGFMSRRLDANLVVSLMVTLLIALAFISYLVVG
jgi:hypothetical protein